MASREQSRSMVDWRAASRGGLDQFRDLNFNQPGQWPLLPRLAAWTLVVLLMVVLAWFLLLSDQSDQLQAERDKEPTLKSEYRDKLAQAINLDALKAQKEQVQEYVTQLEKQLPGKAEMDALLTDINQAGVGRGLVIDQFVPGQVELKDYYAELPIAIKVTGRYHDIGAFAGDIASLSRIVTLHNLNIATANAKDPRDTSGTLSMEATARTYRYLDAAEVAEARKANAATAGKEKK